MSRFSSISPATVSAATQGKAVALDRILEVLQGPFYNLALRMLLTHADAQDATQECLLRVVTRLSSYRGDSKFSTWAWRVAVRRILDFKQARFRQPMLTIDGFAGDLADGLNLSVKENADDRILLQQVKLGCGRAMLQCLDGDHRLVYVLGEIMEIPGPEAAEIIELSATAFRKRLSRARERVRDVMQPHCGIVNPKAQCRCQRRLQSAQAMGRLAPEDEQGTIDIPRLREFVEQVDELHQAAAVYRVDPQLSLPAARLNEIKRVLRVDARNYGSE